mmetsp:Transcript_11077/g.28918  ORF Transcript_11077/g.28918 Transcript_11077/m.28918 type:complete len:80 (-) Transcript_11077:3183-3422(-)
MDDHLLAAGTSWIRVRRVADWKSAGCGTSRSHGLHALRSAGGGSVSCKQPPRELMVLLGRVPYRCDLSDTVDMPASNGW